MSIRAALERQLDEINDIIMQWMARSGPSTEASKQEFFQGNIRALTESQSRILHDLIDWNANDA